MNLRAEWTAASWAWFEPLVSGLLQDSQSLLYRALTRKR